MAGRFDELLKSTFAIREEEGPSKITTLQEAVRRNVKPGMKIHFSSTHCSASAAIYEIIRQFMDKDPQFTLVGGVSGTRLNLVHLKMVKKVIGSFAGNAFPMPGPNPVVQKAYKEGTVEFEHWTMNTLPQRLMAAALGVGFTPTRSIMGSSMAEANQGSYMEIEDPFESGKKRGLVKALYPDINFVHGWAAGELEQVVGAGTGAMVGFQ